MPEDWLKVILLVIPKLTIIASFSPYPVPLILI